MDLGLANKVVLVTAVSGDGVGSAVARPLAAEGSRVAIAYRSRPEIADKVAAEVEQLGGRRFRCTTTSPTMTPSVRALTSPCAVTHGDEAAWRRENRAGQLGPDGILVNVVSPGAIRSPLLDRFSARRV